MLICAYVGKLDRMCDHPHQLGMGKNVIHQFWHWNSNVSFCVKKRRTNRWEIGPGPPQADGRDGRPLTDRPKQSRASRPAPRKRTARVETEPKPMLSMPFMITKQAEPTSRKSTDRAEPKPRPRKPFTNLTQAEPTSRNQRQERKRNRNRG
ncbi:hypothetical protein niasHT_008964 [Heterodera trifolii]|uniref:Uncharacterized protein n=1 Tax=Heterodera trifolii TaxID=157864 RepID=A0ABD2LE87_9BILA